MRTFRDSWNGLFACHMPVLLPTDGISQLLIQCLMHIECNVHCVCVCSNVLHILRPAKAPGFAYAWLELVSHRIFVGRVLSMTPQQRVSYGVYCVGLLVRFVHCLIVN